MKRDPDIIRSILLELEAKPDMYPAPLEIEGITADVVSYHIQLLVEAGLVEGIDASSLSGISWYPSRMTYDGHELLGSIRDNKIWHQTKELAKSAGTGSVKALFDIALSVGKQKLRESGIHF